MRKYQSIALGVLGMCMIGVAHAYAAVAMPDLRYASGEIAAVDVKLGTLQLRDEAPRGTHATTEYRMNPQATNVTDPSDKKFLTLEDLRSGQQVAIEFDIANNAGERMARKITVESTPAPVSQEAAGMPEKTTTTTTTTTTTR